MESNNQLFELRTYYTSEEKMEPLINRFRMHTFNVFRRLGITMEAFWVPLDNIDQKIIYLLSFPDQKAYEERWITMKKDPDWLAIKEETNKNGDLVNHIESTLFKRTSFSPQKFTNSNNRVFELRVYTFTDNNKAALLHLFETHLINIFTNYGMTNIFYGIPADNEKDYANTFICILAHSGVRKGKEAFEKLEADKTWLDILAEANKQSGAPLINAVKSVYLYPMDFSPLQ